MKHIHIEPVSRYGVRGSAGRRLATVAAGLMAATAMTGPAFAQDSASADKSDDGEIVVTGALNALPNKDVGSIFGFAKTLVEAPHRR